MALDLKREANRVELRINNNETKVPILPGHHNLSVYINGQSIEVVD